MNDLSKHLVRPQTKLALKACVLAFILGWSSSSHAAKWTRLTNLSPSSSGTMMLLTDGTVMVQGNPFNTWMRLTPSPNGSYANGTWSALASMSQQRLYFASHVLQNGKVWVLGGEYSGPQLQQNLTNTGELYDPVSNTWSPIAKEALINSLFTVKNRNWC